MGSGASVQNEIPKEWMDIFKAMKLKPKEVQKLYNIYNTVDADRSGSIDVSELLMFMDIERSPFTQRIFEAFDKDHTHRVDFYEFVVSAWKFCALGKEATCVFAFDLYDSNADGKLTSREVTTMFQELMGAKALEQEAMARTMNKLLKEAAANDDFVTVDYFRLFTNQHQALLLPVFGIQNMLRISTLGVAFWDRMSKRRIELRPGVMVPLSELMVLHAHRKLFGAIMENKHSMGRVSSMMRIVLDNTNNAAQHTTPPPSPKPVLRNTKILNPFAAFSTAAVVPVAPVMVHGNFASAPSSPASSYRLHGGLGGIGYPSTPATPHTPHSPLAGGVGGAMGAASPRSVVMANALLGPAGVGSVGSGSGSGGNSPATQHSKHHSTATHNNAEHSPHSHTHAHGHGHGHSSEHSHSSHHGHSHSTHSTHSTHNTTTHSSERSAHLHSGSHSSHHTTTASVSSNASVSASTSGDSKRAEHTSHHSHHHHNHNSEHSSHHSSHHHSSNNSKEHSPRTHSTHHSSHHSTGSHHHHHSHNGEHSSRSSHHSTSTTPTGKDTGGTNGTNGGHLTPAQLLQSHPNAKRTTLDKPL